MKKRKIAVLIGLFACALLALGLAACGHQHTYGAGWTYDATHHWHEATCEHTGEKDGYAEHTWDGGTVTTAATCTEAGEKTYTCTVCSATKTEVIAATGHTFAEEWTADATHHWHAATCEHTEEKKDYAEHTYENGDCILCGYTYVSLGLQYTLSDDGTYYTLTGTGTNTDTDVVVPSAHNGLPVTSIGEDAFYGSVWIKSVFIPDSVKSIGNYAFENCNNLTSVTIGNGVKSIGDDAFSGCHSLTSIIIPDSVTSIGDGAFRDCDSLTSIIIPGSVASIGNYAFSGCDNLASITVAEGNSVYHSVANCLIETASKTLIAGCKTSVIPADGSVTIIGQGAFSNCNNLTSVIIPDSITSIGSSAFSNCNNLTSVTIGSGVQSIGSSAFSYCYKLVEVYNKSKLSITVGSEDHGEVALYAMNVYTQEGGSRLSETSDGYLFYYDGSKGYLVGYHGAETALTLPASFTTGGGALIEEYEIAERAFYGCTALKSVTIPDSVTVIGDNAFADCTSLTSVIIPDGVTGIGDYAFSDCYGLTSVIIPDSVMSIGNRAFESCGLTSVTIGSGVQSIGSSAFRYCYKLIEVYNKSTLSITEGREDHGEVALYALNVYTQEGGSRLTDTSDGYRFFYDGSKGYLVGYHGTETALTLPASFKAYDGTLVEKYEIAERAFYNCTALKSVTIPESVTGICDYAFSYCDGLTSVTIGNGVKSIGVEAFAFCYGLTSVTIGSGVTSIGDFAFSGCINLASIVIPNSVTSIGNGAFEYCNRLTSVTIGSGVTSIGDLAFSVCINLASIVIPNGVTSIGEGAFAYCNRLTSVTIGSGVTSIGDFAFSGCINLASIVIPNGVTSIGEGAFAYCNSLTSVIIPESVTSIGDMAFAECNTLEAVYYCGTATQWQAVIGSDSFVSTTTVYYYSETQPTEAGNWWHFDTDGVTPVKW